MPNRKTHTIDTTHTDYVIPATADLTRIRCDSVVTRIASSIRRTANDAKNIASGAWAGAIDHVWTHTLHDVFSFGSADRRIAFATKHRPTIHRVSGDIQRVIVPRPGAREFIRFIRPDDVEKMMISDDMSDDAVNAMFKRVLANRAAAKNAADVVKRSNDAADAAADLNAKIGGGS